jgi:hypothetical protein
LSKSLFEIFFNFPIDFPNHLLYLFIHLKSSPRIRPKVQPPQLGPVENMRRLTQRAPQAQRAGDLSKFRKNAGSPSKTQIPRSEQEHTMVFKPKTDWPSIIARYAAANIDTKLDRVYRQIRKLENINVLSHQSWLEAWSKHPDLYAQTVAIYRDNGITHRLRTNDDL